MYSRIGTFAVVCLMTGKAVTSYSAPLNDHQNVTTFSQMNKEYYSYTPIQVATAVTLSVGLFQVSYKNSILLYSFVLVTYNKEINSTMTFFQIIMYIFRLGVISTLLSETLVNSFTTGAAVHVLLSQIKDLLGLKLPKQKGYFKLIQVCIISFKIFCLI